MYPVKTPRILRWPYPEMVWQIKTDKKEVFLTFDDGPIPEVTPWVLAELKKANATAMFFMVGENVVKHPNIFNAVAEAGHGIGNHTYNHLTGWKTSTHDYLANVEKCNKILNTPFFRPPHGRIKKSQLNQLKQKYHLIMWDVLSADFDENVSPEQCLKNVLKNIKPGSIVVFHDSIKAMPRLKTALPLVLQELKKAGFSFGDLRAHLKDK